MWLGCREKRLVNLIWGGPIGTADIHALVLGRALTGIPAFAAK